jgi:hypothetical protein
MKKINKKDKKAKEIAFKIMRTKLDIKINKTPLYFGKEKSKKKGEEKSSLKPNHCASV